MAFSSTAIAAPSAADLAMAETLFREGKQLMGEGKFDQACPKLQESLRLDPVAGGTLLTLALCHEGAGKTATAWAEFNDAKAAAARDGREDRVKLAQRHIDAIEPRLSRLTIQVPPPVAAIEGLSIQRDGVANGRAVWGVAIPVDPGRHTITATAPGYESWTSVALVGPDAARVLIAVPAMRPAAQKAPVAAAPPPPSKPESKPAQSVPEADKPTTKGAPVVGYVVGGVGIVGLGLGSYFGLQAMSKRSEVETACPNNACSTQQDVDKNDEARTAATISNVALGVGLAGTIVGAYLIFGQDNENDDATTIAWSPSAGPSSVGATLTGAW
jgi:hypothetical protein